MRVLVFCLVAAGVAAGQGEDAGLLYRQGRALVGKNTPEAILRLRRAAALDPKLPEPHLALAEIFASPNFKDDRSLLEAIRMYRKLRPESLAGFSYLGRLKDAEEIRRWAADLRRLLTRSGTEGDGRYWKLLWGAEFRSVAESEYAALRRQVAADIEVLERRPSTRGLRIALMDGYRLVENHGAAARLEQEFSADLEVAKEQRAWEDRKGLRTRNTPMSSAEREALAKEQASLAAEWVRRWPSSRFAWSLRLGSLPRIPGWTKEELEQAGERVLELGLGFEDGRQSARDRLRVAEVWIRHGVRLTDAQRLAEEALREIEKPEELSDLTADANAVRHAENMRFGNDSTLWDAMGAVIDGALRLNDVARASEIKVRMRAWIKANEHRRSEAGSGFASFERLETVYAGKLAEAEGRVLDALAHYAKALAGGWVRDEVVEHARELWLDQGGSREAWEMLTSRPAPAPRVAGVKSPAAAGQATPSFAAFQKMEQALKPFELRDLEGNVWTLEKLKGKRTFINVWATWCFPCREELPEVQKLYERVKGRDDIQVLTLNVDEENPGLVQPFLDSVKGTFPVLKDARGYVMELVGFLGIPQNWLVDRNGVLRAKGHGFDGDVKGWAARVLEQLEALP